MTDAYIKRDILLQITDIFSDQQSVSVKIAGLVTKIENFANASDGLVKLSDVEQMLEAELERDGTECGFENKMIKLRFKTALMVNSVTV